jgi:Abnormal spindle-like microcephaly-assoc'd, ASPM-SPD-2-Hydin/Viral BACON domain
VVKLNLTKAPPSTTNGEIFSAPSAKFPEEAKKSSYDTAVIIWRCIEGREMKYLLVLVLLFPLVSAAQIQSLSCSSTSIIGAASDVCTVALNAPAGRDGLTVSLNSSNPAVTLPSHIWVAPHAASLSFTATVAAVASAQTAILEAFYNYAGVNSPQTFSLNLYPPASSGSTLSVTPSSLSFGSVTLNTASALSVTLKNTGNSPVTGTAAVTGAGFSMSPLQGTLSPGQSSTAVVQFDPSSAGAATGSLTIQTNAENSLVVVPLTGTGGSTTQPSVTLSWDAPASSPAPITGYVAYRSTNGGAYTALNSTPTTGTTYVDTAVQSGVTYSYYVESVASNGLTSQPSSTVEATGP